MGTMLFIKDYLLKISNSEKYFRANIFVQKDRVSFHSGMELFFFVIAFLPFFAIECNSFKVIKNCSSPAMGCYS